MLAPPSDYSGDDVIQRRAIMAICAEAKPDELRAALARCQVGDVDDIRSPETGLVMLRGRIGGDGAAFNAGEATVTRAAVSLSGGATGFAYHLGRDAQKARDAAILDALWQSPQHRHEVQAALAPIADRLAAERSTAEQRTAATRVNFFTMVRGED